MESDFVAALRRGAWGAAIQADEPWTGEALAALIDGYVRNGRYSSRNLECLLSLFMGGLEQVDVEAPVGGGRDIIDHLHAAKARAGSGVLRRQLAMVEELAWKKLGPSRYEVRLQAASAATEDEACDAWR